MRLKQLVTISINSLIYLLIAFLVVKNLTNLYGVLFAKLAGYDATLLWYGFTIDWESSELSNKNITLIYMVSFLVVLVTGIVFEYLYRMIRRQTYPVKMLLLWIYVLAFSRFAGYIGVGAFKYYGMGVFFNTFQFSFTVKMVMVVLAILLVGTLGFFSSNNVRTTANLYFREISDSKLSTFFIAQMIVPVILAFPFMVAYKYPMHAEFYYLDSAVYLGMVPFLGGLMVGLNFMTSLEFNRGDDKVYFFKNAFLFLIILFVVFRLGLNWGIQL